MTSGSIPEWPNIQEKIKEVRQMKPPYFYFFSLPESSCQVSIQAVEGMPDVDTTQTAVQMISVRKDDWEKGLSFDQKMDRVVEQGSSKVACFFFLDSMLYVVQSLLMLKEKVANDKIIVYKVGKDQVRFQEEAQVWLLTLYDNWMDNSDKDAKFWQCSKRDCMWEQVLFTRCVAAEASSQPVDPSQIIQDYMEHGTSPFRSPLFTNEEKEEWKRKVLEKVAAKQDGTYDIQRIRQDCFATFAEWDVFQAVSLFLNYLLENSELFPEYRQVILSLCKEYVLTRPDKKEWLKKCRNAMVDMQMTPV